MGCGSSTPAEAAQASKSAAVDRDLKQANNVEASKIKMLLLGAGDCGKSTIFKQMRLLYGAPRTDDELRMYGVIVRSNIVVTIRKLCSHLRTLDLESSLDRESEENTEGTMTCRQAYDKLKAHLLETTETTASTPQDTNEESDNPGKEDWVGNCRLAGLAANDDAKQFLANHEAIQILWESDTMKKVWAKRSAIDVGDAHKEFLDGIPRIASPDFKPTTKDVLIARVRTTQIVMEKYLIKGAEFELYDVGGQRSERRKWIHAFDNVMAVIFVAALSGYDQCLAEARKSNRMVEALELFRSVVNNSAFEKTSIILFLNKRDLFAEKIMRSDIAAQKPFSDYGGPTKDYDRGVLYFIQRFKESFIEGGLKDSFIHVTCATDTNNMERVLDATATIIKNENLKQSGFQGLD